MKLAQQCRGCHLVEETPQLERQQLVGVAPAARQGTTSGRVPRWVALADVLRWLLCLRLVEVSLELGLHLPHHCVLLRLDD